MDSTGPSFVLPALPDGRFTGRTEFADLIRNALAVAAVQGWREMTWCDPTFEDWPLGERAVAESLTDWAKTGRKLTMMDKKNYELLRRHARFVTWRRTWAHIIECRRSITASGDNMPSALLGPNWVLERLELQHCTVVSGSEAARRVALRERINERLHKSVSAFPATTAGL